MKNNKLKSLWIDNLNLDDFDSRCDYFELGGNSLTATKLIIKVKEELNCVITLNEFFLNSNYSKFLQLIKSKIHKDIIEGEI
ncbi:phosphopantetheine-binding protein [Anaerococcus vaginalis]|uniref:phosphopantetheine-binding protein n=1 Tax=Anaerococcus vaginalis TaxID=33037 RepID=UPI00242F46A2|nr:phosphopantetheine-binding protein [Anaerococcus vaginalis]